jgi:hypothetical protein
VRILQRLGRLCQRPALRHERSDRSGLMRKSWLDPGTLIQDLRLLVEGQQDFVLNPRAPLEASPRESFLLTISEQRNLKDLCINLGQSPKLVHCQDTASSGGPIKGPRLTFRRTGTKFRSPQAANLDDHLIRVCVVVRPREIQRTPARRVDGVRGLLR